MRAAEDGEDVVVERHGRADAIVSVGLTPEELEAELDDDLAAGREREISSRYAHPTQVLAAGLTWSRSTAIGRPQTSQVP